MSDEAGVQGLVSGAATGDETDPPALPRVPPYDDPGLGVHVQLGVGGGQPRRASATTVWGLLISIFIVCLPVGADG